MDYVLYTNTQFFLSLCKTTVQYRGGEKERGDGAIASAVSALFLSWSS